MKKISEKTLIIIVGIVVVILAGVVGGMSYAYRKTGSAYTYAKISRGDLIQRIAADGTVKAADDIDLSFQGSGKVLMAGLKAGDKVKAGQVLAKLDTKDINADISQSSASVAMAEAQLEQLKAAVEVQKIKKADMQNGAKPEEIKVAETVRDNAKTSLANAQTNLADVKNKAQVDYAALVDNIGDLLSDAHSKAFDALYHQTNQMFDSNTADPHLFYETPLNTDYKLTVERKRVDAQNAVTALGGLSQSLSPDYANYADIANRAVSQLSIVTDYLNTLNTSLNYTVSSLSFPATTVNLYRGNISSSLTSLNSIIPSINSYRQSVGALKTANDNLIVAANTKVSDAQNALKVAEDQLALAKSGPTADQLAAQDAVIDQAMANVKTQEAQIAAARANAGKASSQLDKMVVKSPIDGTITRFDVKVGELASPGTPVISVMSDAKYQIESYLPENALPYVKIGNAADVTLDQLGSSTAYEAKIINIDPAATIVNGNPVYKATLEFAKDYPGVKPGLTANVQILTRQQKNALIIPATSLIKEGGSEYVIVDDGGKGEKRRIETGDLAVDGKIGVVSGLKEGDSIAVFGGAPIIK